MEARELAVHILDEILYNGAYSNIILGKELKNSELNSQDKALVTELVYGTIKYKYSIDNTMSLYLSKNISSVEKHILNILRVSFYQLIYLDKIPEYAVVNEAVNLSKKSFPGLHKLVNGILRNHLRKRLKYIPKSDLDSLCFNYSFEPWMVKLFLTQYGRETAESILSGLNQNPNITVRVNTLKTNFQDAFNKLEDFDYDVESGEISPDAIRIIKGRSIESNPLFIDGYITVQDESAMLVAPLINPDSNDLIMDLCSAPGGKSTHISELMENKGTLLAFDIHEGKLNLIKDNAERLGISNIKLAKMDAAKLKKEFINTADKILIDVPCSGIGIIRKKPEIKWNKTFHQFKSLVETQKAIINNAILYLKENGTLLYSTCTLNKSENEHNIKWLLKKFPNMKLEPIFIGKADNIIYHEEGYITILPNKYMDGFFIAKLIKTSGC
ncbi:16S rRNA (cytosine(967)-C(5))-methyltransferase RsmB [Clostridium polynesiense]|uniref:16S rRNA (cytosine(967)-C(5))-methyltransferase RsmB n=1 Tax=Clostridium polynesiense TaxID=1325933 RepID=UPI000590899F|nr:16S rRNA (cytosine(967)-C(5))-methyltransferase RsmB [Clostridium polynesiense]